MAKPPREAPAIPRMTVTIKRPGSGPGTIRLAKSPAMVPTTIQLMKPIYLLHAGHLGSLSTGSVLMGDWIGVWPPLGFSKERCFPHRARVGFLQTI
jgi:hypothetical protein